VASAAETDARRPASGAANAFAIQRPLLNRDKPIRCIAQSIKRSVGRMSPDMLSKSRERVFPGKHFFRPNTLSGALGGVGGTPFRWASFNRSV
jgi:hypothetical protein